VSFFADIAVNPLLLSGLAAGIVAGITCGVMGPYVVIRRIAFLSGAIAHMAVGGIGAAIFLRHVLPGWFGWLDPFHGAVAAAVLGAVSIALAQELIEERIDTLIGAMWAIGMAVGVLLVRFTPGYHAELMSYLFGNISVVRWADVGRLAIMAAAVIAVVAVLYKRLLALSVDEEYARLQGVSPLRLNIILLVLVALTVVSLMQIVGLILVIALLTLPAATVGHRVQRLGPMIIGAVVLSALLTTLPRIAVYGTGISPEAAIVLAAGFVYLVSVVLHRLRTRRP